MTDIAPKARIGEHGLEHPERALARVVDRLAARYDAAISRDLIERLVAESFAALNRTARIKTYLVPRTERFATDRLRALAQEKGLERRAPLEVLFVCVGNAGRSQMAAVFAKQLGGDRVGVRTAGSAPDEDISPTVVEALAELGLDVGEEFPKPLTDDVVRAADVVITMGCGDACPYYPGKRYEDWPLDDPKGQDLETVRRIRDDIRGRVEELVGAA